ncbi:hypothetical protein CDAR_232211 [Caerostris darwini]|uniref:Uncharacterized protein n=1 Tax=Caerostris darwini TaxID=1538125 RepID=A0AAV4UIM4_9ARAC|nr:hypothetical protein CDAR_232211 [Caerostris darwini]
MKSFACLFSLSEERGGGTVLQLFATQALHQVSPLFCLNIQVHLPLLSPLSVVGKAEHYSTALDILLSGSPRRCSNDFTLLPTGLICLLKATLHLFFPTSMLLLVQSDSPTTSTSILPLDSNQLSLTELLFLSTITPTLFF